MKSKQTPLAPSLQSDIPLLPVDAQPLILVDPLAPSPASGALSLSELTSQSHAVLVDALDQTEQVKEKVEECAIGLSIVNAVLARDVAMGAPLHEVKLAIAENEAIEGKVQECVDELATVNKSLTEELDIRKNLYTALDVSNAALAESQALEAESAYRAMHDAATGLPNLTLFNDRLGIALTQAKRHQRLFAVMFIDLDKFKQINDTFGHDVGDSVLSMIAQRLQLQVRAGDTVSRRSGDEFLVLMLDIKDAASAVNLATKINSNLAIAYQVGDEKISLSASIGIALYPAHGQVAADLLKNADTAMYAAKQTTEGYALYAPSGGK